MGVHKPSNLDKRTKKGMQTPEQRMSLSHMANHMVTNLWTRVRKPVSQPNVVSSHLMEAKPIKSVKATSPQMWT